MAKPLKTYNPTEHYCAQCGRLIITHTPTDYLFKLRPGHKGPVLWFCKPSCMTAWKVEHPVKDYRRLK